MKNGSFIKGAFVAAAASFALSAAPIAQAGVLTGSSLSGEGVTINYNGDTTGDYGWRVYRHVRPRRRRRRPRGKLSSSGALTFSSTSTTRSPIRATRQRFSKAAPLTLQRGAATRPGQAFRQQFRHGAVERAALRSLPARHLGHSLRYRREPVDRRCRQFGATWQCNNDQYGPGLYCRSWRTPSHRCWLSSSPAATIRTSSRPDLFPA